MKGKDIFLGLDYVGGDLIENAEYGQFPSSAVKTAGNENKAPEARSIRRPLLIAAIVALMLLLMGCAAAIVLYLDSIRLGEEIFVENMRHREDSSKDPETEKETTDEEKYYRRTVRRPHRSDQFQLIRCHP